MSFTTSNIFSIESKYEDEFGTVHPHILTISETVWQKSENFFSKILHDRHRCLEILIKAAAIVSQKYDSDSFEIKNPTSYLYTTFRRLVLAEIIRQKRHRELESEIGRKHNEPDAEENEDKICQKILINQLRARMDDWMRDVFDLQVLGYQYKDLVPRYGSAENVVRSRYSKGLSSLKHEIQAEMDLIEKELKI